MSTSSAIAISPSFPNFLLTSGVYRDNYGHEYRLFKTSDSGETWEEITLPSNNEFFSLAFDPFNPQRMYASSAWGIFRSSDGGNSWVRNEGYAYGYSLVIDPNDPETIYSGYNSAIYKSTNGGLNFTKYIEGLNGNCNQIALHASSLYFGSSAGLFKSMNDGQNWIPVHKGMGNLIITLLTISPSSPNVIYTRGQGSGLYKSQDSGKTWMMLPNSMGCDNIRAFVVSPSNSQEIFALSGG